MGAVQHWCRVEATGIGNLKFHSQCRIHFSILNIILNTSEQKTLTIFQHLFGYSCQTSSSVFASPVCSIVFGVCVAHAAHQWFHSFFSLLSLFLSIYLCVCSWSCSAVTKTTILIERFPFGQTLVFYLNKNYFKCNFNIKYIYSIAWASPQSDEIHLFWSRSTQNIHFVIDIVDSNNSHVCH